MEIIEENDFVLNQIETDEFNRTSAILAINNPKDLTSHDIVNEVRRKLRTRKVGHAGALDPFATGVLIILVGKHTKHSDFFLNAGKEYRCKVLFGVSTSTQDPEGKVIKIVDKDIEVEGVKVQLESKIEKFKFGYMQRVPVFSSVKVNGQKLRQIARQASDFVIDENDNVIFSMANKNGEPKVLKVKLPRKKVEFTKLEIEGMNEISVSELPEQVKAKLDEIDREKIKLVVADMVVGCSKGTYVRQLAEDLGEAIGLPAMLLELERTRVGKINLNECTSIGELPQL